MTSLIDLYYLKITLFFNDKRYLAILYQTESVLYFKIIILGAIVLSQWLEHTLLFQRTQVWCLAWISIVHMSVCFLSLFKVTWF